MSTPHEPLAAAIWVPLDSVQPWPNNPRSNDEAVPAVAESIARFGFGRPFVGWDPDRGSMLVVGHTARKATLLLLSAPPVYEWQLTEPTDSEPRRCTGCQRFEFETHAQDCPRSAIPDVPERGLIPIRWRPGWTEAEARAYAIADNQTATLATWEPNLLAEQLLDLQDHGLTIDTMGWVDTDIDSLLADLQGQAANEAPTEPSDEAPPKGSLVASFGAPPFSVLDTRQGYWQDRRRWWRSTGLDANVGRENLGDTSCQDQKFAEMTGGNRGNPAGGSTFDPVLSELLTAWFSAPGDSILDPFAGGPVRGVVAAALGRRYTGVDVRAEQVTANRAHWADMAGRLPSMIGPAAAQGDHRPTLTPVERSRVLAHPEPEWVVGDSTELPEVLPDGATFEALITCPPYGDLEVYSDDPRDLSVMDWDAFLRAYRAIFAGACARLCPGAFAAVVVGEIRDSKGGLRGFVQETISAMGGAGMTFYNDAILLNMAGTAPIRAAAGFNRGRKLTRVHQYVLVFCKGKPRRLPPVQVMALDGTDPAPTNQDA